MPKKSNAPLYKIPFSDRTIRRLKLAAKLRQCTIQEIMRTAVANFLEFVDDSAETDEVRNYLLRRA